jgi:hypothetical protein
MMLTTHCQSRSRQDASELEFRLYVLGGIGKDALEQLR